jgi:hypothetical protein
MPEGAADRTLTFNPANTSQRTLVDDGIHAKPCSIRSATRFTGWISLGYRASIIKRALR